MRTLLMLGFFGVGILPTALLRAETPADQITESIDRLGSKRPAARERAAKVLEFAGEPALEALRKAALSDDIEVSRRAEAILARIEREIDNRKNLQVQRYSFKFDDDSLRTVVAEFKRKFKTDLHLDEKLVANPRRTITFEVKDAAPFEAISKFMEVAGLKECDNPTNKGNPNEARRINGGIFINNGRIYNDGTQQVDYNRFVLMDGKSDLPSVNAGPLRIRALPPAKEARAGNPTEVNIKLDVSAVEQKNFRGLLGIDVRRAIDEHGQNLTQSYIRDAGNAGAAWSEDLGININFQLQNLALNELDIVQNNVNPRHLPITFFAGKKPSGKIELLEGVIHGRTLTPPMTLVTVEDVSKVSPLTTFKASGISVQILETQLQPKTGKAFVRYRTTTTVDPFQNEVLLGNLGELLPGQNPYVVKLIGSDGKEIRSAPVATGSGNNDGFTSVLEWKMEFTGGLVAKGPIKFVVTGPKEVDIAVPFVLKNIQLQ